MLRETTLDIIENICKQEKQRLIRHVSEAEGTIQRIFDLFLLIAEAQEEDYRKFELENGFVPKDYEKVLQDVFGTLPSEDFFGTDPYTVRGLNMLLGEARHLAYIFVCHTPVFAQIKVLVNGVLEETIYSLFNSAFPFTPGEGFSLCGRGPDFKARGVRLGTNVELKSKVVPCPLPMLTSIIMSILDDDNWRIEEVDDEHFEGQVFQWDKAFASLFEVKHD